MRRREEDISEASTQGVRSGGRQRTAGSGVNGSRTRSTKRSGRRERTQAYGVVSVRKTRKHDGVDVPTWTPQHQREAEGNRFRKLPNGGPLHSLLSLISISGRIFSSKFLNPKKGRKSHDTKEVSKCQQSAYVRTG